MGKRNWIVLGLGVLPLAACGATNDGGTEGPVAKQEQAQEIYLPSSPPLLDPQYFDLGPKLGDFAGYPDVEGATTPGMIAAVVRGRHIIALGAKGYAKLPEKTPMTSDMVFNIGSNTKSISATLLSILIHEHPSLSWSTTLAEALPWAAEPGKEYFQPLERKNVTLEQLVAHRSGINCARKVYPHTEFGAGWKSKTRPQLLKEYLRGPEIAVGGEAKGILADCRLGTIGVNKYENENFAIVEAVIQQWSGMLFDDYARQKLIEPKGFSSSYLTSHAYLLAQSGSIDADWLQQLYWNPLFFRPSHPKLAAGLYAWGHNSVGTPNKILDPDVEPWGISPARGGFAFDAFDYARYAMVHLRDTSPAVLDTHRTPFDTYNFGWNSGHKELGGSGGIRYLEMCHNGGLDDLRSRICVYPDLDMAYFAFSNGGPDNALGTKARDTMVTWMRNTQFPLDAGGCVNDGGRVVGVQRFRGSAMYGCAGKVTYPERASLCAVGHHVCSAQEYVNNNSYMGNPAEAPKNHYWTNDNLKWGGTSSNNCWAATTGNSCGDNSPMRACASQSIDTAGNKCNWVGCGYAGSTDSEYFGGCANNPTAGTLCCKD